MLHIGDSRCPLFYPSRSVRYNSKKSSNFLWITLMPFIHAKIFSTSIFFCHLTRIFPPDSLKNSVYHAKIRFSHPKRHTYPIRSETLSTLPAGKYGGQTSEPFILLFKKPIRMELLLSVYPTKHFPHTDYAASANVYR